MRTRLVITDVARMNTGVCVAGYAEDGRTIRPVTGIGSGIPWHFLRTGDGTPITPFSVVEFDLSDWRSEPPHLEDRAISPSMQPLILGALDEGEARSFLSARCAEVVSHVLTNVVDRRYVQPGTGSRSLGTIRIQRLSYVGLGMNDRDRPQYRVAFRDQDGVSYTLTVTDIAFRAFSDVLTARYGDATRAAIVVKDRCNRRGEIFLRLGLSRPFAPSPEHEPRCYLMVTGIYTFPSYLDQPWAAYYPQREQAAALRSASGVVMPAHRA